MSIHDMINRRLQSYCKALAVLALSVAFTACPASAQSVEYTVSLPAPQTQMVDIAVRVPQVSGPTIDFMLPVWRPGRYVIMDMASTIRNVRAFAGDAATSQPLEVQKIDKATWRVTTGGENEITLAYRVYANSLNDRTRHVDDTHAFLSPAAVFMYEPSRRGQPLVVRINAPDTWRIATGLDHDPNDPRTLIAPNYDVLVDSPIEIGVHDLITLEALGKPHEIAIWGKAAYEAEKLKTDFAKIILTQAQIFGELPYERYVFILHIGAGARGGTEHLNSTVIQASRAALEEPDAYRRLLRLVSHEMFHTWNVKQFRPAGMHPYDYQRENYTKLLWVVEGSTTYYEDVALVRAGLVKPKTYLEDLSKAIDTMRSRPGELAQSVEQSSFDSWIQFHRTTPDDVNSRVSFYSKGAMVSLLLDMTLRSRTNGSVCMDHVMRALYERFPLDGPGYTPDNLRELVEELSGLDFGDFFTRYVRAAEPLNLEEALAVVGLELYFKPSSGEENDQSTSAAEESAGTKEQADEADATPRMKAYIGLKLEDHNGRTTVSSVLSDGPAYMAGILAGDEIVAMDGLRLPAGDLNQRLKKLKPDQTVQLTILRRDILRTIPVTLAARPDGSWKLRRMKEPTEQQKAEYESWLGQPWE